jgi:hypothetical protein
MIRCLDRLNTTKAVVVVLAVYVFVDSFLFHLYRRELTHPAVTPIKPAAALPIERAAAAPPGCSASGVRFLGYSDALDGNSYKNTTLGGLSGLAYDADQALYLCRGR